jgi:glycosyltransferase involved in cell wall biosynthesis
MAQEKSVLIVTCFKYPHTGGLSRGIGNEMEYFKNKGYNVKIISPTSDKFKHSSLNNIYVYVPSYFRGFFNRFLFFLKAIPKINFLKSEYEIHLIDCHDIFSYLAAFVVNMSSKSILTLHSIQSKDIFTMSYESKKSHFNRILYSVEFFLNYILELIIFNIATKIACVSEYEYNDVINKKILKNNAYVSILRNGTPSNLFSHNAELRESLKKIYGINKDEKVVMFLGRMVPKNSPFLILQAINLLKNKSHNVKYIFVGDGEEKRKLEKFALDNELYNKVIFTGEVNSEKILNMADIFVSHCSSLVDGPGRTTFEAMLLGVPVITGKDYIKESIFSEDEICLIPKDNYYEISRKVCQLLIDDSLRKKIGESAKRKALNEFTLEAHMNKLEQFLRQ